MHFGLITEVSRSPLGGQELAPAKSGQSSRLVSHYSAIGDTISCDAPYSAIGFRGELFLRFSNVAWVNYSVIRNEHRRSLPL